MQLLFFLKPIADLLWQFKFFNLFLGAILYFLVIGEFTFRQRRSGFFENNKANLFLSILLVCFLFSLLRDIKMEAAIYFLKILTAFCIFFLAQAILDLEKIIKFTTTSLLVVISINFVFILLGKGTQVWGKIFTYTGLYYFKYDFALVLFQFAVFLRKWILFPTPKIIYYCSVSYIFILAPLLIFLSNSRIFLIIYSLFIGYYFWERSSYFFKKSSIKTNRLFLVTLSLLILVLYGQNFLSDRGFFYHNGFLTIATSEEMFFSRENTQGRNEIWATIFKEFNSKPFLEKMIGFGFTSDIRFSQFLNRTAHNSFLKVLISTGYLGLTIYLFFLFSVLKKSHTLLNLELDVNDRFYVNTAIIFLTSFLIASITSDNLFYTQTTWFVFLFSGFLFNNRIKQLSI